jgi:hypothetical protein
MKVRKNKHYTTIQVEEFTPKEFRKVKSAYQNIDDIKVIKANRKYEKDYFKLHSQPLSACEVGDCYRILGLLFKVKKIDIVTDLVTFEYFKDEKKKKRPPLFRIMLPLNGYCSISPLKP